MCSCTPSAILTSKPDEKTLAAVGEMVNAAVKHYDPNHTGPVEFTVLTPREFNAAELGDTEVFDA
jgi:hypothetical protein